MTSEERARGKTNTVVLRFAQDDEGGGCFAQDDERCQGTGGDEGYVLLAVLVLVFLMLLTLSIAAPKVAMQLKHDQELETQNRANQYVRAIRVFYRKNGSYPSSIEQLENTNNQRFLRQRYVDPLTGKDDWKLIRVGQNKTTVKGFFGKDLPGMGAGLGAAAGMQSNMGGPGSTGSSFGSGNGPGGSSFGGSPGQPGGGGFGGAGGGPGTPGPTNGAGSGTGNPPGTGTGGVPSTDASGLSGSTGPIMGVGVAKDGDAFLTVNGVSTYQEWEFLYDPRIEQLAAQSALAGAGGGGTLSPPTSPFGPPSTTQPTPGQPTPGQPTPGQPTPGQPTPTPQ